MGRGRPPAAPIPMTSHQKEVLEDIGRKHTTGQQIAIRIKILLLANEGHSNAHITRQLGISLNTVKLWRNRWQLEYEDLVVYESYLLKQQVNGLDFRRRLIQLLKGLPRIGAPKIISLAQEKQIIALACEDPVKHQVEMTNWTHEMLAKVAIAKGIVASISSRQVGRILKKQPSSTA